MAISPKIPSLNQLLTLVIAIAIIFFVMRMAPESIKQYFRV